MAFLQWFYDRQDERASGWPETCVTRTKGTADPQSSDSVT